MQQIKVCDDRLWNDLMTLGNIGANEKGGVTRTALSDDDQKARLWLIKQMTMLDMDVNVDGAMNVIGRFKAQSPTTDKVLAIGSHIDTVPNGGKFDGAYGVLAGLECIRTLKQQHVSLPFDIEVISFCDEEAAHNAGTVGSRAMMGKLQPEELEKAKTAGARPFLDHLKALGKSLEDVELSVRNPDEFICFMEAHIEQGKILESEMLPIGVVTAIVGVYRYIVTVRGEAAHAGTTPMNMRRDALVEAAPIFTLLPEWTNEQNPEMVGTIGQVTLLPGASNVVPKECRFFVELRSQHPKDMKAVRERLIEYAGQRKDWCVETIYEKDSVLLDDSMIALFRKATEKANLPYMLMPSGAGHDAQSFAPSIPTGMIFIPCEQGISHNPKESISKESAGQGCQVLLNNILLLAESR
ncbi:M20 family metallo-hydrolase [Photobacterium sp. DNB23_23_1]